MNDGFEPINSADHNHGAYGNWRGEAFYNTFNWVEYEFPREYALYESDVYWWNDGAGIGTPTSNYLEYWDSQSEAYKPVSNPVGYGKVLNQYNKTKFDTVITDRIRIYSKSDLSTGILEWKVFGLLRGNVKPLVTISSPSDQSEFSNGQPIDIIANATDSDGQVVKVEFYVNDILIGSATGSPFKYQWMPDNNTRYFVKAIAYDNSGGRTVSSIVKFKVGTGKEIYWSPSFDTNSEFSMSRSKQSEDFIIFWGKKFPADQLPFNPTEVLSLAEGIYDFYIRDPNGIKFISDAPGTKLGKYKMIIIINETWENESFTGWAYGAGYDNTIGALWIHYGAVQSPGYVIAHELAHSLQAQVYADNPNSKLVGGFIWETHAEFMTVQKFKDAMAVGGSDIARYLRTASFGWLSDRHHYACWYFFQHIADKYGVEIVNRLWYEKQGEETPVATLARLIGTDQQGINDEFGIRSMKNVTWDYSIGSSIREAEKNLSTYSEIFLHDKYTVPDAMDEQKGWYRVPRHKAPQDYGYNIIPLYPNAQNGTIDLGFSGYDNAPAGGAGWRYGFVAVDVNGSPRYSPLYKDNNVMVTFDYTSLDKKIYLVVTGTPDKYHPFVQWDQGYQKTYRYPYKIFIGGAKPEGYSPGYNKVSGVAGAAHPNGGGFVAATANVSSSAFVGPNAQVLETAVVSGNARIEDYAIIKGNAQVRDNAVVKQWSKVMDGAQVYGNAFVSGTAGIYAQSEVYESGQVTGSAGAYFSKIHGGALIKDISTAWDSNFSGTLILGGDAEPMPAMSCDKGTYLHSMYTGNRNCDGLTEHNLNVDINPDVYANNDIGINQSISFSPIGSKIFGDPDFNLSATASSKLPVNYSSSDPMVASIDGSTVTILKVGTTIITASQAGDDYYRPAPEKQQTLIVNMVTAVEDSNQSLSMSLFPNPASEELNILLTGVEEDETSAYTIYDILGRVMGKYNMVGQESTMLINHYSQGKYILRLSNKKFTVTRQFIK